MRANALLGLNREQSGKRLTKEEGIKLCLTTSAPALIQPEEADQLIDFVVDESELINDVTVDRMETNEKDFRFLDISGGILRQIIWPSCVAGTTINHSARETLSISNTNKCLRTMSLDAAFYLHDDDIEDGLTGAQLEDQILRMAGSQMANEEDFTALMGNANASYSRPALVANEVLHLRDGWYRQLQFGNLLDANAIDVGDRTISFDKLTCMLRALPTKYQRNLAAKRIYLPTPMWWDYARLVQGRQTVLGDLGITGPVPQEYLGVPFRPLALMPTDISTCGCASLPANGTFMFVTNPANLILGIERNITFERERWATNHITWFIWTIRFDMLVLNEEDSAMVDCMQLVSCGDSACDPEALADQCNSCLDLGSGGEP
jgi:hypothetical protein